MAQYLTSRDVQKRYKLSRSSLYRHQEDPQIGFPKPVKIGYRILWREADLDAFDSRIAAGAKQ